MADGINNFDMTIGTTQTEVVGECFQVRKAIIITNTSTGGQVISLAIGQEAVANKGIVLYPGGTFRDTQDGQYFPSNKQINAISSLAGGTIAVLHRVLDDRVV